MITPTAIFDCRGVVIGVGDTVVYPGRRGSSLWLNEGTVLPFTHDGQRTLWVKRAKTGRVVEIFNTQRVAVVAKALPV